MKSRKPYFVFNNSQRNGVLALIALIILLIFGMIWANHYSVAKSHSTQQNTDKELLQYRTYIDSVKQVKAAKKETTTTKIYPFNPNFITDYKGYTLGMSPKEIDRLQRYREKDKWINSTQDFKRVTQVSDSLLNKISPYFKFPEWVTNQQKKEEKKETKELPYAQKKDLNTVDKKSLQHISGIGEVLSARIIRYRTKIGGFVDDIQLKDIYGLPYEAETALFNEYTVKTPTKVDKLNINTASVIELSEVIYFDYELAREIIDYRILNEGVTSFEELSKIESFPSHKIDRIKLYLYIN